MFTYVTLYIDNGNRPILLSIGLLLCKEILFLTKFAACFGNLLETKCTKFYLGLFRFNIFIVRCLGGYFRTQCSLGGL